MCGIQESCSVVGETASCPRLVVSPDGMKMSGSDGMAMRPWTVRYIINGVAELETQGQVDDLTEG